MVLDLARYFNYTRVWGRSRDYGTKKNEQQKSSHKNTCDQLLPHNLCICSLFIYSLIRSWRWDGLDQSGCVWYMKPVSRYSIAIQRWKMRKNNGITKHCCRNHKVKKPIGYKPWHIEDNLWHNQLVQW